VFPKNIGIVFLEQKREKLNRLKFWKEKMYLDFDQLACAHLILRMNRIQNLFDYQIINPPDLIDSVSLSEGKYALRWSEGNATDLPFAAHEVSECQEALQFGAGPLCEQIKDEYIVQWFDDIIISKLECDPVRKRPIDYYIGITSESIGSNYFLRTRKQQSHFGRIFSIISSDLWEKDFSPPSVFEYIAIGVFTCSLRSIALDIINKFPSHDETHGCIFDYTGDKPYRRIVVSNPNICSYCRKIIQELEVTVQQQTKSYISLSESVNKILSRKWMGSIEEWGSPIYNLNKNYKYNVDHDSGFNKTIREQFIDSIKEKSAEWIIGGVGAGVIIAIITTKLGLCH
jgi:hypothetical protein